MNVIVDLEFININSEQMILLERNVAISVYLKMAIYLPQ